MPKHNQLLLNGYTKTPIKDKIYADFWMLDLVDLIDMKILMGPFSEYVEKEGNKGITCVSVIETSHIALHIWDEPDPAQIQFDLYTCSDLPVDKVIENLKSKLGLYDFKYMVIEREDGFNIDSSFYKNQTIQYEYSQWSPGRLTGSEYQQDYLDLDQ
jgi:S-adenosylmethionine/arginine decarboxylase-like enzyme